MTRIIASTGHIWRVEDGKFVEHWDELNLLEVFQQIGAATLRKPEGE